MDLEDGGRATGVVGGRRNPPCNLGLENYTFLTPRIEIKKANLHEVSTRAILGRFSNPAALNV